MLRTHLPYLHQHPDARNNVLMRVFAHRGASALAPENTLAAFRLAAQRGATWVELDVDVIGDGTPIVIHDSTLDRTTNRSGRYDHLTRADLAMIDAGSWFDPDFAHESIPTLEAALETLRTLGLSVNVEIKSCEAGAAACRTLVDATAELIEDHIQCGGSTPLVSSFNPLLLDRFRQRAPHIPRAVLFDTGLLLDDWRSYAENLEVTAIHPSNTKLSKARVEDIRARGYDVNVWTVNDRPRAEELASWGVTGIFTDRVSDLAA